MSSTSRASQALATTITYAASKQTYYTIRLLVDRDRVDNAFRAYGYFRWLDDCLDQKAAAHSERIALVDWQKALMECCYEGYKPLDITPQEQMLVDLIQSNPEPCSGLQAYIQNMFAVMAFDAERRGQLISQEGLDTYSRHLARAVTEALHYFIGHDDPSPLGEARYLAVTAAHITHMLRDTYEDVVAGYFNIPCEFVVSAGIPPCDIASDAYRSWVKSRVDLAHAFFSAGRSYLTQVANVRCRIAGYAYIARFEGILNTIEREGYRLRVAYYGQKSLPVALGMAWSVFLLTLGRRNTGPAKITFLKFIKEACEG